jgi:tripartite-type tricarboxylate transporter receptor subunit TctC
LQDFTHIALFGGPPIALCVNPALQIKDLAGLVALARSKPLSYGSPGTGTQGQLIAELFKQAAGIEIVHVPYKGASPAIADLVADHVQVASTTLTTASAQIHAGKITALAISSRNRLPDYPEVPTFAEMGYPQLVASVWFSLSGPAGMPADVVQRLNAEVRRALEAPEIRTRMRLEGMEPNNLDAAQFTEFVRAELSRWTPVVKGFPAMTD